MHHIHGMVYRVNVISAVSPQFSKNAVFNNKKAIRGGVPVVFRELKW